MIFRNEQKRICKFKSFLQCFKPLRLLLKIISPSGKQSKVHMESKVGGLGGNMTSLSFSWFLHHDATRAWQSVPYCIVMAQLSSILIFINFSHGLSVSKVAIMLLREHVCTLFLNSLGVLASACRLLSWREGEAAPAGVEFSPGRRRILCVRVWPRAGPFGHPEELPFVWADGWASSWVLAKVCWS